MASRSHLQCGGGGHPSIYHHNSSSRKEEATLDVRVRPRVRPRVPSRPQSAAAGRRRILRAKSRSSNAIGVLFAHFKKSSESGGLAHTVERELRRPSMLPTTAEGDKFCKYGQPLKYHMRVVRLQVAGASLPSSVSATARADAAIYVPRDLTVTICFLLAAKLLDNVSFKIFMKMCLFRKTVEDILPRAKLLAKG